MKPAKSSASIKSKSNKSKSKSKPYDKTNAPVTSPVTSGSSGDKTLMTVNGRAIRQMVDGRMYVLRNDKRVYI